MPNQTPPAPAAPPAAPDLEALIAQKDAEIADLREALDSSLPEAGAVVLFDMYSPGGMQLRFTLRYHSWKETIDELGKAIEHAKKQGFTTQAPKPPAAPPRTPAQPPAQAPAAGAPAQPPAPPSAAAQPPIAPPAAERQEVITVATIARTLSRDKTQSYLTVTGRGPTLNLGRFGIPAYEEFLPNEIKTVYATWPQDTAFAPPNGMGHAIVSISADGKTKKVIGFQA